MARFDLSITLEYELVMESHQIPFVQKVNEWISQGWQPLGGPFVYEGDLCQAMVREKPVDKFKISSGFNDSVTP